MQCSVKRSGDCDDAEAEVNPEADEVCDGEDNDCDGDVDEGDAVDAETWHADNDEDGYGDPDDTTTACDEPSGYTDDDSDCDDNDEDVNPEAEEVCDGVDNDCDGTVDNDDAVDAGTWYLDDDGDGYGVADSTTEACEEPTGYADNTDDCNDDDAAVYPGSSGETVLFTLQVCIDGSDSFHFAGDEAWWVHYNYQLPGAHSSCGSYSTTVIDGDSWSPTFASGSSSGSTSDVYSPLPVEVPDKDVTLSLSQTDGRTTVTVTQDPEAANAYEGAIYLDDDVDWGPDVYEVEVSYTCD